MSKACLKFKKNMSSSLQNTSTLQNLIKNNMSEMHVNHGF